jgi:hypothetical protein
MQNLNAGVVFSLPQNRYCANASALPPKGRYLLPFVAQPDLAQAKPQKGDHPQAFAILRNTVNSFITVAANLLGFAVAGLPGAILAGGLRGLLANGSDQYYHHKKIDPNELVAYGLFGLIPNLVGEAIARQANHVTNQVTDQAKQLATRHSVGRTVIINILDGAILCMLSNVFQHVYQAHQKHQKAQLPDLMQKAKEGLLPGILGGALAGIAFTRVNMNMKRSILAHLWKHHKPAP